MAMPFFAFTGPIPLSSQTYKLGQFESQTNGRLRRKWRVSPAAFPRITPARGHFSVKASVASPPALEEGTVLQFQSSNGIRRLARAVKPDGKRNWIVSDANGTSHSITPKQVTFILGQSEFLANASENLQELQLKCEARANENQELLQVVWEVVHSGDGIDESNLADVPFVSDVLFSETEPLSQYATHLLLSNDELYFKERNIKGQILYEARSERQVEEARLLQEAQEKRRQEMNARQDTFVRAWENRSLDHIRACLSSEDFELLISGLKEMAAELDVSGKTEAKQSLNVQSAFQKLKSNAKMLVQEALSAVGKRAVPSAAMETLVRWGVYRRHENLVLLNSNAPHLEPFNDETLRYVKELLSNPPEDPDRDKRQDLTHLTSVAIDSADTSEVDDAISWDPDTNQVLVHIADPTRFFPEGPVHPLLKEVFRRVSTLYLPYTKYTMFPESIANNLFSLDGIDAEGCALTIGFKILEDGSLAEASMSIRPTLISPPIRFTYEEAEEALSQTALTEENNILHILYGRACARKEWREMEGGAIIINNSLSDVKVKNMEQDEPDVSVNVVSTGTKSWTLVSELMITACTIAANIAADAKLPVVFRGQEPFEYPEDDVLAAIPDGPARAAIAFRNASAPQANIYPMEHASLGLDAYLQITSPIRRTTDLIGHFQLKAFLRGEECPFSAEQVQEEIARTNDVSRTVRLIENRTNRYWQHELLRRMGPDVAHEGTYVRPFKEGDRRLAFVYLDEYAITLVANVPQNSKPGGKLKIRVYDVDPRTGTSKASAVLAVPEEEKDELETILDDALSDVSLE